MKKISAFILMVMMSQTIFAYDTAKLQLKIAGQIKPSDFLCINNMGCYAVNAGTLGHTFAIDLTNIDSFALLNLKTNRAYVQALPDSCHVTVGKDQTLVISGKLNQHHAVINQLACSVQG